MLEIYDWIFSHMSRKFFLQESMEIHCHSKWNFRHTLFEIQLQSLNFGELSITFFPLIFSHNFWIFKNIYLIICPWKFSYSCCVLRNICLTTYSWKFNYDDWIFKNICITILSETRLMVPRFSRTRALLLTSQNSISYWIFKCTSAAILPLKLI